MISDSVASASSWEPFRRTVADFALAYFGRTTLIEKYKNLLDMISWGPPPTDNVYVVQAKDVQKTWARHTISMWITISWLTFKAMSCPRHCLLLLLMQLSL